MFLRVFLRGPIHHQPPPITSHHFRRRRCFAVPVKIDDWIDSPRKSMHAFMSFLFPNNSDNDDINYMPDHKKHSIAKRYERGYRKKALTWDHITYGKNCDTADLIEGLRHDEALGALLGRVEMRLEGAIEAERSE